MSISGAEISQIADLVSPIARQPRFKGKRCGGRRPGVFNWEDTQRQAMLRRCGVRGQGLPELACCRMTGQVDERPYFLRISRGSYEQRISTSVANPNRLRTRFILSPFNVRKAEADHAPKLCSDSRAPASAAHDRLVPAPSRVQFEDLRHRPTDLAMAGVPCRTARRRPVT